MLYDMGEEMYRATGKVANMAGNEGATYGVSPHGAKTSSRSSFLYLMQGAELGRRAQNF